MSISSLTIHISAASTIVIAEPSALSSTISVRTTALAFRLSAAAAAAEEEVETEIPKVFPTYALKLLYIVRFFARELNFWDYNRE